MTRGGGLSWGELVTGSLWTPIWRSRRRAFATLRLKAAASRVPSRVSDRWRCLLII